MRRGRILILIGLILALGTAAAVYVLLQGSQAPPPEVPRERVVVAVQPIDEDEPIEGRVEVQSKPVDSIPEGAVRSLEATSGMIAAGPIPPGTILHPDMMLSPQEAMMEGELGKLVEVGKVAVALPIDELSSVSYGVKPGDYVDLLITFSFVDIDQESQIQEPLCPIECPGIGGGEETETIFEAASQIPRLVSQLTVQDAAVLGVGRWLEQPVSTEEQQAQEEEAPQPKVPEYVTLMVTPQDALVLKLAREYGASIDLAVRAQDDHQAFVTEQVTLDYVLARFGVSLPGKQPYTIENMRTLEPQPQPEE